MFSADLGGAPPAATPAATNPPFQKVALLLHGDGTNGAQNNTFLDSSTNNFTITRAGNVAQGTFSPFSLPEGQWSNYFDGSGDYLSVTDSANLRAGTGDYTIEFFVYQSSVSGTQVLVEVGRPTAGPSAGFQIDTISGVIQVYAGSTTGTNIITASTSQVANTWYHIAMTRAGGSTKLFINGVQSGSTATDTTNYTQAYTWIGANAAGGSAYANGYISNVRYVVGTAVYTANFTPPTSALTAVSGTSLLTCQSNRFKDNSSNNFTITRNGDTKVTAFSPFSPSAAYSASTNGGSAYFDGSGDTLTYSNPAWGTGNWTVEFFVYSTNNGGTPIWLDTRGGTTNGQAFYYSGGYLRTSRTDFLVALPPTNSWEHIAFCKSGSTQYCYVNGVLQQTKTDTYSYDAGTGTIGGDCFGYVSNLRIVVGTAVYTTNFTPPTAPLTAVANTQLLLNCTNAAIYDNAGKNDIETVGNAQISTSVKKYGTGSIAFDGGTTYLSLPDRPEHQLGLGNFTIEAWVYVTTTTGSNQFIAGKGPVGPGGWAIYLTSTNAIAFQSTNTITSVGTLALNTWHHLAIVRAGTGTNQTTVYINGVADGVGTVPTDLIQTQLLKIGCSKITNYFLNGYIDDLRITKGQALYTANFTPPTQAFPNV